MNTFRQHIPNFVDIDREPDTEFSSVDELLALPKVKQWAETMSEKLGLRFNRPTSNEAN